MARPSSRRGFLRSLTSLPLIGGGLAIVGAPSAVAEPITDELLDNYLAFLAHEHREALVERERRSAERAEADQISKGRAYYEGYAASVAEQMRRSPNMLWFPDDPGIKRTVQAAFPSTRAALVLSAVGLDWRRDP